MSKITLEERIEISLRRSIDKVFLRKEFDKFGGYDQVGRALRGAINKGLLLKTGYGVYVKAKKSALTGKPVPVVPLIEIGIDVLTKLGVKPELAIYSLHGFICLLPRQIFARGKCRDDGFKFG